MGSDVLLGHEGLTPVYLRDDHRTAHVAILGKSRFGKTTLLEHLILNDIRCGIATIVIDAHGDLSKRLVALAPSENPDRLDDPKSRIVLIEPNDERPFGLNLYECPDPTDARQVTATVGSVVEIFRKLMGAEGTGYLPLIESGLRNTARALIANRLTMAELPLLYHDPGFRARALATLPDHGDYWREYETCSPQRQQDKREPVLNKVARFLEDDIVALMVKQTVTTVPFTSVMDKGGTLLLNLAGLDRDTVSFLGMVFLSVFSNLIHQRERISPSQRRRVHLYLDEYGRFATPTTKRLLQEGGKYGLGVTIAHQNLRQTPDREALDVQTLISFQLDAEDADRVAGNFDCTPVRTKRITRQRTEPQYREWEEDVWDSGESHTHYDVLYQALTEAESRLHKLKCQLSDASQIHKALYPPGDPTPAVNKFDSADGTVQGVYVLKRLRRNGGDQRRLSSGQSVPSELRDVLTNLYERYGREPRGVEFWEAHQWLDRTATHCEEIIEEAERLLPEASEEYDSLKSKAESFYRHHTSRQWKKEYIGEAPVKEEGQLIYDQIEELAQSHADRKAELANMLTQLPRYVAYCKVLDTDGKSHEHRIEVLSPAKPETNKQKTEDQLEREARISKKLRGVEEVKLVDFGSWSPETGFTFKQKEFQEAMAGFMRDIRYGMRSYDPSPELQISQVRKWSRDQFGTPRAEIEEQIQKRRQMPPPSRGGKSVKPAPKTPEPPPPVPPPPRPTIGRRSPRKPR